MKLAHAFAAALAVAGVSGSNWFAKTAYNSWHETELERWLSDRDIPYPTPADRKDLEKLIEANWNDHVLAPFKSWSETDLSAYLENKGIQVQEDAAASKDLLIDQVRKAWYQTEDNTQQAWATSKDWILDTWTESQLKAFCDRNGIPVPQPRKRDTLLQKARTSYESVAKSLGESAQYPGNWLYSTWANSDLKEWLDLYGFPAPQPTTRDKLIAAVRRNSHLAHLKMRDQVASASASAQKAYETLTDKVIDAWGESDLKDFLDKNGVPVPQGTKANELRALVRKHRAAILGDTFHASATAAFGAATSKAGNQYARATDSASQAARDAFDAAVNTWSESRLKAYLDARGVPIPHVTKTDELRALVRKHAHSAASGWTAWTFDDLSYDNLKNYLTQHGDAAAKKAAGKADATREDLVKAANSAYASASSVGGESFAVVSSYVAQATDDAKQTAFDSWSESDLKAYLDSYGIRVPQGSTMNELRAFARKQHTYFKYGTTSPSGTIFAQLEERIKGAIDWAAKQLHLGANAAEQRVAEAEAEVKAKAERIKEEL